MVESKETQINFSDYDDLLINAINQKFERKINVNFNDDDINTINFIIDKVFNFIKEKHNINTIRLSDLVDIVFNFLLNSDIKLNIKIDRDNLKNSKKIVRDLVYYSIKHNSQYEINKINRKTFEIKRNKA